MKFDANAFSFLNDDGQYLPGWNNVTHEELKLTLEYLVAQGITKEDAPDVFGVIEAFNGFMLSVGLADTTDPVLGVKIDEGGVLEQVNGPAIFAGESGPILRVGEYKVPVTLNGSTAKVGQLEGDISVAEVGEGADKYCVVTWEFFSTPLGDNIEIAFILDNKERPEISGLTKGKLKQLVKSGEIAGLLRAVPSGESFVKPRDLEVGEYSVVAMEENEPHKEYGRSWKVVLEGVGPMMTTGKRLNGTLERQAGIYFKWLAGGNPLTFAISKKEEISQGVMVSCGFFKRAPNPARLVSSAKPMVAIAPESMAPALPAQTVTVPAAAVVQPELGEIPF